MVDKPKRRRHRRDVTDRDTTKRTIIAEVYFNSTGQKDRYNITVFITDDKGKSLIKPLKAKKVTEREASVFLSNQMDFINKRYKEESTVWTAINQPLPIIRDGYVVDAKPEDINVIMDGLKADEVRMKKMTELNDEFLLAVLFHAPNSPEVKAMGKIDDYTEIEWKHTAATVPFQIGKFIEGVKRRGLDRSSRARAPLTTRARLVAPTRARREIPTLRDTLDRLESSIKPGFKSIQAARKSLHELQGTGRRVLIALKRPELTATERKQLLREHQRVKRLEERVRGRQVGMRRGRRKELPRERRRKRLPRK